MLRCFLCLLASAIGSRYKRLRPVVELNVVNEKIRRAFMTLRIFLFTIPAVKPCLILFAGMMIEVFVLRAF